MGDMCPLLSTTDEKGLLHTVQCKDSCSLNLGVGCAIKILGVSAWRSLHPENKSVSENQSADVSNKE